MKKKHQKRIPLTKVTDFSSIALYMPCLEINCKRFAKKHE
jgi:hypothetical protein